MDLKYTKNIHEACVACEHDIRHYEERGCTCYCEIDNHYIGYCECFEQTCEHFVKEKEHEKSKQKTH